MKKWLVILETESKTIEIAPGAEVYFDAHFHILSENYAENREKFVLSVSDNRVSRKVLCSLKSFGDVSLFLNGVKKSKFLCHLKHGDKIEAKSGAFEVKFTSDKKKRTWSKKFTPEMPHPTVDNALFPAGWSEPGHNLIYFRPNDCSRFGSNKGFGLNNAFDSAPLT